MLTNQSGTSPCAQSEALTGVTFTVQTRSDTRVNSLKPQPPENGSRWSRLNEGLTSILKVMVRTSGLVVHGWLPIESLKATQSGTRVSKDRAKT